MPRSTNSQSYRLLCALLIARRKELGLSQYDLAKRLNRPQSLVAKIERGDRSIDIVEFLDIAHALELDPCHTLLTIDAANPNHPNSKS